MQIKPDEITSILKERIQGLEDGGADLSEVGTVLSVADGNLEQAAGALDLVALLDPVPRAEQHGADVVGLEVQGQAGHVVRQLEQLERHAVVEAVQARDAVGHREDRADLGQVGAAVFHALDALLEDARDLVWLDLH